MIVLLSEKRFKDTSPFLNSPILIAFICKIFKIDIFLRDNSISKTLLWPN